MSVTSTGTSLGIATAGLTALLLTVSGISWRAAWAAFTLMGVIAALANWRALGGLAAKALAVEHFSRRSLVLRPLPGHVARMPEAELKNIALLIDADNASHAGIDPVLTVLAELGQVNIRRAYGNWAKPALANWNKITHRFGLQPMQQFDLTKGKNATDIAMAIDAIDLLNAGKVDGFGIMSSDSDFTPLVTRLRQDGLIVYGFGSDKAPEAFRTACTRYIDVDQLIRTSSKEEGKGDNDPIDKDLIDLLGAAWKAASRDDDGFAKLQEVGQIAGNRSSFDVRNHGYKRLSELVRAAGDYFKLERGDDNQLYIKRLR